MRSAKYVLFIFFAAGFMFLRMADQTQAATFTVNSRTDTSDAAVGNGICDVNLGVAGNQCTLRAAIEEANAVAGDDTINFSVTGTITLNSQLYINSGMTIDGPGWEQLSIVRNISQPAHRLIFLQNDVNVTIEGLNFRYGEESSQSTGGAIHNSAILTLNGVQFLENQAGKGAIYNSRNLTVINSIFEDNSASEGGAIYNAGGSVTVTGSTFTGNSGGDGGGIYNKDGQLSVTDSMFNGNTGGSSSLGGAIYHYSVHTAIITNSIIMNNISGLGGGITSLGPSIITNSSFTGNTITGSFSGYLGGGIYAGNGQVTVINSTFSGNQAANNRGAAIGVTSLGSAKLYNVTIANNSGVGIYSNGGSTTFYNTLIANNTVGVNNTLRNCQGTGFTNGGSSLSDDSTCNVGQTTFAALNLGALANNGGTTQTHALMGSSVAINTGNNSLIPDGVTTDQRGAGFNRVSFGTVDVGAFEAQSLPAVNNPVVNVLSDGADTSLIDGACDSDAASGNQCSLRAALENANGDADADTITFSVNGTINLTSALPDFAAPVTIDGPGGSLLTIARSSGGDYRIFTIPDVVTAHIEDVQLTNGKSSQGGAIQNAGLLTVFATSFTGSNATTGGAISNSGTLTLTNSSVTGNSASTAGAISNTGSLTLTNSSLDSNSATTAGAISNSGTLNISNSTMSGNTAATAGAISNTGTLTLTNSTIAGNSASTGGAIVSSGTATLTNSTISGNTAASVGGIQSTGGAITLVNSTISGNSATGGVGGMSVTGGSATLYNVTVANNKADSDNNGSGSVGGLHGVVSMTAHNTLLVNNMRGAGTAQNCGGVVTNGGGSITSDTTCSAFLRLTAAQINLGALANNGGQTQTHALLYPSAAIDAGDNTLCANAPVSNLDQRGVVRPFEGDFEGISACDAGAFEANTTQMISLNPVSPTPTLTPMPTNTPGPQPTATLPHVIRPPFLTNMDFGWPYWVPQGTWQRCTGFCDMWGSNTGYGWQAMGGSNQVEILTWTHHFNLSGMTRPIFEINYQLLGSNADAYIDFRPVGSSTWWYIGPLNRYSNWDYAWADLTQFAGQTLEFRFYWEAYGNSSDIWRFDNIYFYEWPQTSAEILDRELRPMQGGRSETPVLPELPQPILQPDAPDAPIIIEQPPVPPTLTPEAIIVPVDPE